MNAEDRFVGKSVVVVDDLEQRSRIRASHLGRQPNRRNLGE